MKITDLIKSDPDLFTLCTGCGTCTALNPDGLRMEWSDYGFLRPTKRPGYEDRGEVKVCPFNPAPESEVRTEDELAELFLTSAPNHQPKVGRHAGTYVAYSNEYRLSSSSGGLATYVSAQLLERGVVDAVASVWPLEEEEGADRFAFRLTEDPAELRRASTTKYYPVTYAEILQEIRAYDGRVAITGVGCFIKAIRLLQYYEPIYREKIAFTIGIICGGMKSAFFSDLLASRAGAEGAYRRPRFRVKDPESSAQDYSFACTDAGGTERSVRMRSVGDMWGSGYFKAFACDFCDDVTTELADISLGDAWLPGYRDDGRGQNVVVTRSSTAEQIVREGLERGELTGDAIPMALFLRSQQGSFNHRHSALRYREEQAKRWSIATPPKRYDRSNIGWLFRRVQDERQISRSMSLVEWRRCRASEPFDEAMAPHRRRLERATKLYHWERLPGRVRRRLSEMMSRGGKR